MLSSHVLWELHGRKEHGTAMLFTWYVTLSQDVFFKVHFHMKKDLQGSVLEQVTPAQRQKFCI